MGLTLTEKILSRASGKTVSPGDVIEVNVDIVAFHDLTGYHVVEILEKVGKTFVYDIEKVVVTFDHLTPPPTERAAEIQVNLRKFVRSVGIKRFHDVGDGIMHQLLLERYVLPGQVVMGADSHTTTVGALGAFAQGLGASDIAAIALTGRTWLVAPEPMRIRLLGGLKPGACGKDVALHLLREFKAEGLNGKSVEFFVERPSAFPMDYRATVSNMGTELGADAAMFVPDEETIRYIKEMRGIDVKPIQPDPDARYVDEYDVELDKLEPLIAIPPNIDNVKSVAEVEGVEVDYVFIGSCTNGRLSDIEMAARILRRGKAKARCIVIPASRDVFLKALRAGYIEILVQAGCIVTHSTCGPCIGGHFGLAGPGEVVVSTGNRNFVGRMGSKEAKIYVANPAVAAVAALTGRIADPRQFLI